MELVDFLRARLDEDEAAARAAGGAPWEASVPNMIHVSATAQRQERGLRGQGYVATAEHAEIQHHIARQNPARVLAEVEAKRAIVARHEPHSMGSCRVCEAPHWGVLVCDHCYGRKWPCPDLRDLARIHRDRPDFNPAWLED